MRTDRENRGNECAVLCLGHFVHSSSSFRRSSASFATAGGLSCTRCRVPYSIKASMIGLSFVKSSLAGIARAAMGGPCSAFNTASNRWYSLPVLTVSCQRQRKRHSVNPFKHWRARAAARFSAKVRNRPNNNRYQRSASHGPY